AFCVSGRRRHTRFSRDWSSDVCSSDLLGLMPLAWRQLPAIDADWVLASSHLFAHHARFAGPARDAPKLVYAHTPARYIWNPELDARGDSVPAKPVAASLEPLDRRRAPEPVASAATRALHA